MLEFTKLFNKLESQNILVAGDLLLDTYTIGEANRISPEAPVPIVNAFKQEQRAGGAGNTVLNLIAMGAKVTLLSRIGDDLAGLTLEKSLKLANVNLEGLFIDPSFQTPIKNRIVVNHQQLMRIDYESNSLLPDAIEEKIIKALPKLLEGISVVAISDYKKGLFTKRLLQELIKLAKSKNCYIIADPKGTDFSKYSGIHLLKPNLSEAYLAANLPFSCSLEEVAKKLFTTLELEHLIITRAEQGITLFNKDSSFSNFPVKAKQVKDVTGAGDTVLAMLAFALANQLQLSESITLANIAAGIAIERFGCAEVTLAEVATHLLKEDRFTKIFTITHVKLLINAVKEKPGKFLYLKEELFFSYEMINYLLQEKKDRNCFMLVALDFAIDLNSPYLNFLKALEPINFILINCSLELIQSHFPTFEKIDFIATSTNPQAFALKSSLALKTQLV